MNIIILRQTEEAEIVHNETIGTTYVKVPALDDTERCFVIYPNITIKKANELHKKHNEKHKRDDTL